MKFTKAKKAFADAIVAAGFGDNPTLTRKEVFEVMKQSGLCQPYWMTGHMQVSHGVYLNPLHIVGEPVDSRAAKKNVKTAPTPKKVAKSTKRVANPAPVAAAVKVSKKSKKTTEPVEAAPVTPAPKVKKEKTTKTVVVKPATHPAHFVKPTTAVVDTPPAE